MLIEWVAILEDEFPAFDAFAIDFDQPWLTELATAIDPSRCHATQRPPTIHLRASCVRALT
jgi:hypothetical protein